MGAAEQHLTLIQEMQLYLPKSSQKPVIDGPKERSHGVFGCTGFMGQAFGFTGCVARGPVVEQFHEMGTLVDLAFPL